MARPKKYVNTDDYTFLNIRITKELKEAIDEAAERNGETKLAQCISYIEDGLSMDNLVHQVSEHLAECNQQVEDPFGIVRGDYNPGKRECLMYVSQAVAEKMKGDKAKAK